ncbi:hypothetical protein CgunFtcFv8_017251 [Champsocephalus gunnari]|uniref:Uncharacterized protein n=1 Tax=Champsocephalus gunnari TaxID=52237 RepID=A0AAN8DKI9_CHAGU|nr:hypothetical protein CgunFtcFv8_017251 [Champsocephalus gunnari]
MERFPSGYFLFVRQTFKEEVLETVQTSRKGSQDVTAGNPTNPEEGAERQDLLRNRADFRAPQYGPLREGPLLLATT